MHFVPRDKRRITPTGARLFCQLSRMALLEADVNFRDSQAVRKPPLFDQVHWRCHRRAGEMASKSAFPAGKSSVPSQRSRNSESVPLTRWTAVLATAAKPFKEPSFPPSH